ncbi:hypothetical protein chiPu_0005882 [Chiloscyllium punctatum]|uniref:Uncharacterized protein n=1 Tax=Chiloscyllium punctatum TaxID=137246 RepID=A0A401SAM8_CHIPU|nr:hypothetical protein [Chiloscyllium punctatum]
MRSTQTLIRSQEESTKLSFSLLMLVLLLSDGAGGCGGAGAFSRGAPLGGDVVGGLRGRLEPRSWGALLTQSERAWIAGPVRSVRRGAERERGEEEEEVVVATEEEGVFGKELEGQRSTLLNPATLAGKERAAEKVQ